MIKSFIKKLQRKKIKHNRIKKESWEQIMKRYAEYSDGEFIDTLVNNYHPPKIKSIKNLDN